MSQIILFVLMMLLVFIVQKSYAHEYMHRFQVQSNYLFLRLIALFGPFFLFTAFRDVSVGADTLSYYYEYSYAANGVVLRDTEWLYSHLQVFFSSVGFGFFDFVFFVAFIYYFSFVSVAFFAPKISVITYVLVCMSVFLFSFGYSGIRQSITIALLLFSMRYVFSAKWLYFVLFAILAFNIHNASIFAFLLVAVASQFKINDRWFFFLLVISPAVKFLDEVIMAGIGFFDIKQLKNFEDDKTLVLGFYVPFVVWLASLITTFIMYFGYRFGINSWACDQDKYFINRSTVLILVLVMNSLLWLSLSFRLADRMAFYFVPFFALFVSWVVGGMNKNIKGWMVSSMYIIILAFGFIYTNLGIIM